MTDPNDQSSETSRMRRRSFLLAASGGMAAIAGCGYIPGKGDKMWETELTYEDILWQRGTALLSQALFNIRFRAVTDGVYYAKAAFDGRMILDVTEADGQVYGILEDGSVFRFSVPAPETTRSEGADTELPHEGTIEPIATIPNSEEWTEARDSGVADLTEPLVTGHGDSTYVFVENGFAFGDNYVDKKEWGGYAFDENGYRMWGIELERGPDAAAASEDGVAFQYTDEVEPGQLDDTIRYYSTGGELQWSEETEVNVSDMFIRNGYIYAVGYGTAQVFEASTGQSSTLSVAMSNDDVPVFGPQHNSVYIASRSSKTLWKVNLETQSREWEVDGVVGRPATDGETVFAPTEDGLVELDPESGTRRWSETARTVAPDTVLWVGPNSVVSVESGTYLTARHR